VEVLHRTKDDAWQLRPISIRNCFGDTKPTGALWTSPDGADPSWADYMGDVGLSVGPACIRMDVDDRCGITVCDHIEVLEKLPWVYHQFNFEFGLWHVDWESVVGGGVWWVYVMRPALDFSFRYFTRFGRSLRCWDCETVVILDERAVRSWEAVRLAA